MPGLLHWVSPIAVPVLVLSFVSVVVGRLGKRPCVPLLIFRLVWCPNQRTTVKERSHFVSDGALILHLGSVRTSLTAQETALIVSPPLMPVEVSACWGHVASANPNRGIPVSHGIPASLNTTSHP